MMKHEAGQSYYLRLV